MSPETVSIIVEELENLRGEMNNDQIIEFQNCLRLLSSPQPSNREYGKLILSRLSAKFLDPGRLLT
jgi:hypothetical protein